MWLTKMSTLIAIFTRERSLRSGKEEPTERWDSDQMIRPSFFFFFSDRIRSGQIVSQSIRSTEHVG